MTKLSKQASDRLLNLLYTTSSTELTSKIPIVQKFLYEHSESVNEASGIHNTTGQNTNGQNTNGNTTAQPQISVGESLLQKSSNIQARSPVRSILDDLGDNEWRQKPMHQAVHDVNSSCHSNIIRLRSTGYINVSDFQNIFPINRERNYLLPGILRDGLQFEMVKGRNPFTLEFDGTYFLVFENHVQACVYAKETELKVINGLRVRWEFVDMNKSVRNMVTPWIDHIHASSAGNHPLASSRSLVAENISKAASHHQGQPLQSIPLSKIYAPDKLSIIQQITKLGNGDFLSLDPHPSYPLLTKLIDSPQRLSCVLVHNLPFGLSKHTLPRLLWNYDLAVRNAITTIASDILKERHVHLLRFQNPSSAIRFVRNFHGKKWDSMQHQNEEKKLYDPITCEILG